ncbi:MAG: hypothetical protein IPF41_14615 [Flavobacteriales bacterium]|nr:hypothetical protein [Flavobacteriales bacterium]
MIELVWDSGFKRAYKQRIGNDPALKQRFWDALEVFVADPSLTSCARTRLPASSMAAMPSAWTSTAG